MDSTLAKKAVYLAIAFLLFAVTYMAVQSSIPSYLAGLPPSLEWVYWAVLNPASIAGSLTVLAAIIAVSYAVEARPALIAAILALAAACAYQVFVHAPYFSSWPRLLTPASHLLVGLTFSFGGLKALRRSSSFSPSENTRRIENGVFGNADFASVAEMRKRFSSDGEVIIAEAYRPKIGGRFGEKPAGKAPLLGDDLRQGSTHGVLIAGSGGFKTTSVIIPTLWAAGSSCVVFDPKKELADKVQRVRRAHGKKVNRLDPAASVPYGFNALDWVDMKSPTAVTDLFEVANWIIGDGPASAQSSSQFFQDAAKNLIHVLLIDVMTDEDLSDDERTLATVGQRLSKSNKELIAHLAFIASASSNSTAKRVAATLHEMDHRTFSGVSGTANATAAWLNFDSLVGVVSANDFSTQDIRNQQADLFIQTELTTLTSHPGLARVILGALLVPMLREERPGDERVLFLLDEVARLGHMPLLETARDVGRSAGITLILMYQSHGQFHDQWGREGMNKWFENVAWRSYGAVGDYETAEIISKTIGDFTVMSEGKSRSAGTSARSMEMFGSSSSNQGHSASEQRRRLINPDEIISNMPADSQFLFVRGMPPILAGRAIYFRRKEILEWID